MCQVTTTVALHPGPGAKSPKQEAERRRRAASAATGDSRLRAYTSNGCHTQLHISKIFLRHIGSKMFCP